jgi:glycosyltransferase involved in cell wall biosynthesis
MWIVGTNPTPEVTQLDGDGVHVTGRVDDVVPYYSRSTACVVPLRAGGGTRLKILEAMALGRPVVSTSLGCEGLEVVDGEHLFIADSPEQIADKVVRLLADQALRERIASNARQLVVARYDWDVIADSLMRTYAAVAQ